MEVALGPEGTKQHRSSFGSNVYSSWNSIYGSTATTTCTTQAKQATCDIITRFNLDIKIWFLRVSGIEVKRDNLQMKLMEPATSSSTLSWSGISSTLWWLLLFSHDCQFQRWDPLEPKCLGLSAVFSSVCHEHLQPLNGREECFRSSPLNGYTYVNF